MKPASAFHYLITLLISAALILAQSPSYCLAQSPAAATRPAPRPATVVVEQNQVRFAASQPVDQFRLEIHDQTGQVTYDSGPLAEQEIVWSFLDSQGEPIKSGIYSYTLTLKPIGEERTLLQQGYLIIDRASDADRIWITGQPSDSIGMAITGGELTVAGDNETTIAGGASSPESKQQGGSDSRQTGQRRGESAPVVAPVVTAESAGGFGGPMDITSGTAGTIAMFTSTTDLGNSAITQSRGSIGIGTTTPSAPLTVDSSSNPLPAGSGSLLIQGSANKERLELRSAGGGPAVQGRSYGGTIANPTATQAGSSLMVIGGSGHNGNSGESGIVTLNAATIRISAEENWTPTANGGAIDFETTPAGSPTTARAERMRITGEGNVGIGTATPGSKLTVTGRIESTSGGIKFPDGTIQTTAVGVPLSLSGSSPNNIVSVTNTSSGVALSGSGNSGDGVLGGSNSGSGVVGVSASGTGVAGNSVSSYGVSGSTAATSNPAAGVYGRTSTVSGIANPYGPSGVLGDSYDVGVVGLSKAGAGVAGNSDSGDGVIGDSNLGAGVTGNSNSGSGVVATSQLSTALYAVNHINVRVGYLPVVLALASAEDAVQAISSGGNGIFASGLLAAGVFKGDVTISGNLSKGGGAFKIDHPLDPENKYLYHSFVESPDMKNIYDGVVVLDANGAAVVQLPDWFGALNRDFRYLLTPIGAPGPGLYIAEEISANHFKIAGGTAGMRVSWQVTGIRQDAYANKHRIPVEQEKSQEERGYYLHPDAFGQPDDKNVMNVHFPKSIAPVVAKPADPGLQPKN